MNKITKRQSDKSYINYLESKLMAQKQTIAFYQKKFHVTEQEEKRKGLAVETDSQLVAKVNSCIVNYDNGVFGSKVTLAKIRETMKGRLSDHAEKV